jgi:hypothetical protein
MLRAQQQLEKAKPVFAWGECRIRATAGAAKWRKTACVTAALRLIHKNVANGLDRCGEAETLPELDRDFSTKRRLRSTKGESAGLLSSLTR